MSKIVRSWERKVEIAEMALHTHRKAWHQLKMAHAVASGGNWMLDAVVYSLTPLSNHLTPLLQAETGC